METQSTKINARDFFINLGATVALYVLVVSLVRLLFTVINVAYPQVANTFFGSQSISWPVATLIIFFPVFILLMWLLEKDYMVFPERQTSGIHKWLTYINLFVAGLTIIIDLITVLFHFIDGQELTTGFLLKVLVLLVIASLIFSYYLSDVRGKLTSKTRKIYRVIAFVIVAGSIVWGFSVLGSPATQRLFKYDEQKINELMNINGQVNSFYATEGVLPATIADVSNLNYYVPGVDPQSGKPYEYEKINNTKYNLCAEFNKESRNNNVFGKAVSSPYGDIYWAHPAGRHCFTQTINPNMYPKPLPIR